MSRWCCADFENRRHPTGLQILELGVAFSPLWPLAREKWLSREHRNGTHG